MIHPVLVHFTIGLEPTAAACALSHAWRREAWARKAAYAVLTAAAALAVVTMLTGFGDYDRLVPELEGTPARDPLEWHERLGVATTVTVALTAFVASWRRRDVEAKPVWRWALGLALCAATLLIALTGWFGGSLVYDHGVSVR